MRRQSEDIDPSTRRFEYEGYSIVKRSDSIVLLQFSEGYNVTLDDARRQVEIFRSLADQDKCLLLAIFKEDTTFGKDVREFISSDEVSQVIKADALVIRGLALKILTNGYLRINRPNRPSKVFNSTTNAVKWLHRFL
jgi:hypothetical protein